MKHFGKILALGAALAIAAPLAHATSIDANLAVSGSASYTYTNPNSATFTFLPPDAFVTVAGTTATPYFSTGNPISFSATPFNLGPVGTTINLGPTGSQIATANSPTGKPAETLTFFVTSYLADFIGPAGAIIEGTGYFTETGSTNFAQTAATFSFSPSKTGGTMSFSANTNTVTAATPEPSSLVLLGSGLVSAAGMLVRRRRIA